MRSVVISLSRIRVVLLLRNNSIYRVISIKILCLRMLYISRSWCILLKTPAISINIAEKIFLFF